MILLDTHVVVWAAIEPKRLSRTAASTLLRARTGGGLAMSSISLWEMASLFARHRMGPAKSAVTLRNLEMHMKFIRYAACLVALLLCAAGAALAQDTSSFTGTVRDSSGAVVAGAEVASHHQVHPRHRHQYRRRVNHLALPGNTYSISVTAKGFKKYTANGVVIHLGQKAPRGRQPGSRLARQ